MYWPMIKTTDIKVDIQIEGHASFEFPPMTTTTAFVPEGVVQSKIWKDYSIWNYPTKDQPLEYYNDGSLFIKQFRTNTWIVNLNKVVTKILADQPADKKKIPESLVFSVRVRGNLGRTEISGSGIYGFGGWYTDDPYGYPTALVTAQGTSLGDLGNSLQASYPGSYPFGTPSAILSGSSPWPAMVRWVIDIVPGGAGSGTAPNGSPLPGGADLIIQISGSWSYEPPTTTVQYDYFTFMFSVESFKKVKTVDVYSTPYDPMTDYDLGSHYKVEGVNKDGVRDAGLIVSNLNGRFDYGEYEANDMGMGLAFDKTFRFSLDIKTMEITDLTP